MAVFFTAKQEFYIRQTARVHQMYPGIVSIASYFLLF